MILPIVNAEMQHLPTQKVGNCFQIEQTCSNCTYVNIESITYPRPNSTVAYVNTPMDNVGHGYTYNFCPNINGNYVVKTCGDADGVLTCVAYDFEATTSGEDMGNAGRSTTFIILSILLFIITLILLIVGFSSKKVPLVIIGVYVGLLFFILFFQSLINNPDISNSVGMFSMITTLYSYYLWIFYASLVIGVVLLIWLLTKWSDINKKNKMAEWGLLDIDDG